jgi:hypothetical protein
MEGARSFDDFANFYYEPKFLRKSFNKKRRNLNLFPRIENL